MLRKLSDAISKMNDVHVYELIESTVYITGIVMPLLAFTKGINITFMLPILYIVLVAAGGYLIFKSNKYKINTDGCHPFLLLIFLAVASISTATGFLLYDINLDLLDGHDTLGYLGILLSFTALTFTNMMMRYDRQFMSFEVISQ